MEKFIIWEDVRLQDMTDKWYKDWEEAYIESKELSENDSVDESDVYCFIEEMNKEYLQDEIENFKYSNQNNVPNGIIMLGNLQRWNGHSLGYKDTQIETLDECLKTASSGYDIRLCVDENNDFICEDHHHDGVNIYTYREWKPEVTDEMKELIKEDISSVLEHTIPLGNRIKSIYGVQND